MAGPATAAIIVTRSAGYTLGNGLTGHASTFIRAWRPRGLMPDQRAPSTMRLIVRAPTWVPRASVPIQMLAGFGLQRAIGDSRNRASLTS
jgi:hypothetical protein